MSNRFSFSLLIVLTLAIFWLAPSARTQAPLTASAVANSPTDGPTLSVSGRGYGQNITDTNLAFGSTLNVDVNISNAGPITAFDITLQYAMATQLHSPIQTTRAQVTDQSSGQIFSGNGLPSNCHTVELVRTVFPDPFDAIRIAMATVGPCTLPGDGILFSAQFNVVGTNATSLDIIRAKAGRLQELVIGPGPAFTPIPNLRILNADFRNARGAPPVATFDYRPINQTIGNTVTFNATASFDPEAASTSNKGIGRYIWSWGDLDTVVTGSKVVEDHEFMFGATVPAAGYFQVRLVVLDIDDNLPARQVQLVYISPQQKVHDLAVNLSTNLYVLRQGELLTLRADIYNRGTQDENASLLLTYNYQGNTTLANETGFKVLLHGSKTFNYTLETRALPSKVYIFTANIRIMDLTTTPPTEIPDTNPGDNTSYLSISLLHALYQHNVAVADIFSFSFRNIVPGERIPIDVYIINLGVHPENISVAIFYDSHLIENRTGVYVPYYFGYGSTTERFIWDTTLVAPGNYTLSATAYLPTDENQTDNTRIGPVVHIFPPPIVKLTPSIGSLGTTIVAQGLNFGIANPQSNYYAPFVTVPVSFDDQFLGYAFIRDGTFTFTFDVPHTTPGTHYVEVFDSLDDVYVRSAFKVMPLSSTPPKLSISTPSGLIYFPGDSITLYVSVASEGTPLKSDRLGLLLIKPDGTNVTLSATMVDIGVYKVTYLVPTKNSLGTYVLVVSGHSQGFTDGATLGGFEVKPSWISSNGPKLVGAAGLVGIAAALGIAWQKGFIRKKEDD